MSQTTRSGIKAAKLKNLKTNDEITVMFNPFEYAISKQVTYKREAVMGKNVPSYEFQQGGPKSIQLTLYFDTSDTNASVKPLVDKLWKLVEIDESSTVPDTNKSSPPQVAFEWGELYFEAFITNMSQKFTLFTQEGRPLRCVVTVTLEQGLPAEAAPQDAGATSTTQQQAPVTTTEGERPDNMAAQNGGNPNNTRDMMAANNVDNPLNVPRGSTLNRP